MGRVKNYVESQQERGENQCCQERVFVETNTLSAESITCKRAVSKSHIQSLQTSVSGWSPATRDAEFGYENDHVTGYGNDHLRLCCAVACCTVFSVVASLAKQYWWKGKEKESVVTIQIMIVKIVSYIQVGLLKI